LIPQQGRAGPRAGTTGRGGGGRGGASAAAVGTTSAGAGVGGWARRGSGAAGATAAGDGDCRAREGWPGPRAWRGRPGSGEAAGVWSSTRQRQRETLRKVREEEIRLREV
jgi:hypothetical protein